MDERDANGHDGFDGVAELYVLGALPAAERAAFEAHLAGCATCGAEVRSLGVVTAALAQVVVPVDPPAELRERVLLGVAGQPKQVRRTTPYAAAGTRRLPSFAWLATAASLALAVIAGAYAMQLRRRVADLETELGRASAQAAATNQQMAELRRVSTEAQSSVAVLTAPDLARIDLAGQPVSPRATARAFWSRSRGLVFTASNLPPLPAGRTYQLWVITRDPAPVSAGLVKPDSSGRVTAVFETPPDLATPVAMALTIEPDGGVPSPTGDKYLVGQAD